MVWKLYRKKMVIFQVAFVAVLGSWLTTETSAHPRATSYPANSPCSPSPCGPNSECDSVRGVSAKCTCLPFYIDAPPNCRPECVVNNDCSKQMSCINLRCRDPCPGVCGSNATCSVNNHSPTCKCKEGFEGDPFIQCTSIPTSTPSECELNLDCPNQRACINLRCRDPCPGVCGSNATCSVKNHSPTCKCKEGFEGDPFIQCTSIPTSTPSECVHNLDCPNQLACINKLCSDPCPGACGLNAHCSGINHRPICQCATGLRGDPFVKCIPIPPVTLAPSTRISATECVNTQECPAHQKCINKLCSDPCIGACGTNAHCFAILHTAICVCAAGLTGDPSVQCVPNSPETPAPSLRNLATECTAIHECPAHQKCINKLCSDPCIGFCGLNAHCFTINHTPICACAVGLTGEASVQCVAETPAPSARDLTVTGIGRSPLDVSKPASEIVVQANSGSRFEPCSPSPCGANAQCHVVDGAASCKCLDGHTGDPYLKCTALDVSDPASGPVVQANSETRFEPCSPSPCGAYAQCHVVDGAASCKCLDGHTGDPYRKCTALDVSDPASGPVVLATSGGHLDSCSPSPCGANAQCHVVDGAASCKCLDGYTGDPYRKCTAFDVSKPAPKARDVYICMKSTDCPKHLDCINQLCTDPCSGLCGDKATCTSVDHFPRCTCAEGLQGNPFIECRPIPASTPAPPGTPTPDLVVDPCVPFPCSDNARCTNGVCTNITEYVAVPYESCRSGCVLSSECPLEHTCLCGKCVDPCPGTCGEHARCSVVNHNPICSCPEGHTGDPFARCSRFFKRSALSFTDPCQPSPCGPNSVCRNLNSNAVCSCMKGFLGSPPSCRPECAVSTDCPQTKACVSQQCVDPCQGVCGQGAHCEVINHRAICSCRGGQTGDPCRSCSDGPVTHATSPTQRLQSCDVNKDCPNQLACINKSCRDPCPGSCGPNATCLTPKHSPVCACSEGHTGDPFVQCTPIPTITPTPVTSETSGCTLSSECPPELACVRSKCIDTCTGACGLNARCNVVQHVPVCLCPDGLRGDPFVRCSNDVERAAHSEVDPCTPSPCGPNSQCRSHNNSPICSCQKGFAGSPPSCRAE